MGRVSEDETLSGEIAQAPPLADIRYEDEDPNRVLRVLVRVDWAGGKVREYEAAEPQDFKINDPETDVSFRPMRTSVQSALGGPMVGMNMAVPNLRLSFRGNSRVPVLIRTERTAEPLERRPGLPG
jgi:hypothetical protein